MTTDARLAEEYRENGCVVARGLYDPATAREMIDHYMALRAEGPKPGDFGGTDDQPNDPTHTYPRMINMHNWDELSKEWAAEPTAFEIMASLIDDAPVLRQTMIYFKPPGGRGQGLHQDMQYITIDPLIGMWVALDKSDEEVGCMTVAPGTHRLGMLPVEAADTTESFTNVQTKMPADREPVGVDMEPGDALFFHGRLIHGSFPNRSKDRWRRSFICHYVGRNAKKFTPEEGTHVSHLHR